MTDFTTDSPQSEDIPSEIDALRVLYNHVSGPENRGAEVRKIDGKRIASIYVESVEALRNATADGSYASDTGNTYSTINRLKDGVSSRNLDAFKINPSTTTDGDIDRLVTLPIDIDPVRPRDTSATDDQLNAAIETGKRVLDFLRGQGYDVLYSGRSGNGATIFYKIDLPNDPESVALVKGALAGLSQRYSTDAVKIDASIFNPSRIMKVPGTVARKGSHTEKRPWRRAVVGQVNPDAGTVTAGQLAALGAVSGDGPDRPTEPKAKARKTTSAPQGGPKQMAAVDLIEAALTDHGYTFHRKQGDKAVLIAIDGCLTSDAHDDGGYFAIGPSGRWSYGCQHDSCKSLGADVLTAKAAEALGLPLPEASGEGGDAEFHSAEDYWAYLPNRTYIHRESREHYPAGTVDDVVLPFDTGRVHKRGAKAGDPVMERASVWLNRHRAVKGKTWAPGEPEIIEGRILEEGGWRDSPSMRLYNEYHAPDVAEGDPAKAQTWVDLVYQIFPDEAEHIIDWVAFKTQNPGVKINHALVFGGPQGIGKDSIAEPAIHAVGAWNTAEISPGTLGQEFNPWAKSVLLRVSEIRDLSPTEMFALYDAMKSVIASPPLSVTINEKFTRQYRAPNVTGVILTTNHRFGMYVDPDDRRLFCAWSERSKEMYEDGFWDDFYRWLYEEGGNQHVAAFLRDRDLSRFNPKTPPRKTDWWHELVAANRTDEEHEFADALEELGKPDAVTLPQIRATTAVAGDDDLMELFRRQRQNAKRFLHYLDRAGYVAVRNEHTTDGRWKAGGQNTTIYAKKALTPNDRVKAAAALAAAPLLFIVKQQKRMSV